MTLSLCSIVKDEAPVVRRMLRHALPLVDEIVIVDTGSTDDTVDIIREFSREHDGVVKLYSFEWNNDFAAARNFGLEQVRTDWVLVLDADELPMLSCDKRKFHEFLDASQHHGFFVRLTNYMGSLTAINNEIDIDVVRLFRNTYRYSGNVHEQIADVIRESGGTLAFYPELRIHHIGYTAEYRAWKRKTARNTELLEKQIQTLPHRDRLNQWFARSHLLAEVYASGNWERLAYESRTLIEEIRQAPGRKYPSFLRRVYKMAVAGYANDGRMSEAIRLAEQAVGVFPRHPEMHFLLADTYYRAQKYTDAIASLQTCRKLGEVPFDVGERVSGTGSFLAARLTAQCWLTLGDDVSGRNWFMQAFAENQEQPFVIPWIVLLTPNREALHVLERMIQTPQRYAEFVQWYAIAGYDDAEMFIRKARETWPNIEGLDRAQFAFEVRHRKEFTFQSPLRDIDQVRRGLWLYEQEEEEAAHTAWLQGGNLGQYLLNVALQANPWKSWELKPVFMELLAAKALRFLADKGVYASDRALEFETIRHTDLIRAFDDPYRLQSAKNSCVQELEWQAQLWFAAGERERAANVLDKAKLPDGFWTVKGYAIAGDLYPDRRVELLREARKRYPDSEILSYMWRRVIGSIGSDVYIRSGPTQ